MQVTIGLEPGRKTGTQLVPNEVFVTGTRLLFNQWGCASARQIFGTNNLVSVLRVASYVGCFFDLDAVSRYD